LERVNPDRRMQKLAPADYTEDSELMRSIRLSIEGIAQPNDLRRLGKGE
jgi:hypothetical protein